MLEAFMFLLCSVIGETVGVFFRNDFDIFNDVLRRYNGEEENVRIPENVCCIEKGAFFRCSKLKSVIIPERVTYIGDNAFTDCQNLIKMNIPENVREMGTNIFSNCDNLTELTTKYGSFPKENYKILPDVFQLFSTNDEKWIAQNFSCIMKKLIKNSIQQTVERILQSEKFVCYLEYELTDELIRYAIENQAYEIQLMLTDYKYQHFDFRNPAEYLKL
ncbi:MAG: leucine-rich repeat domain-containing protein [Oscillospiraceae bacterium]|nr:leucine-rich repeat domain-containing protein [Oscillospiraceae bacterium]